MQRKHYVILVRDGQGWTKQGDLSRKQAVQAAKECRSRGVAAFVYPEDVFHMVSFAV